MDGQPLILPDKWTRVQKQRPYLVRTPISAMLGGNVPPAHLSHQSPGGLVLGRLWKLPISPPVRVPASARAAHMYVIGKSGKGKSQQSSLGVNPKCLRTGSSFCKKSW
jgi:hypothetical protein